MLEHERQFVLAENVHQRVHHRADARAGQIRQRELPPVGQLARHHVVAAHAQARQADGDAIGHGCQFAVSKARGRSTLDLYGRECDFVRNARYTGVQMVVDRLVVPQSLRNARRAARRNQNSIEFHDLSPLLIRHDEVLTSSCPVLTLSLWERVGVRGSCLLYCRAGTRLTPEQPHARHGCGQQWFS